MTSIWELPMYIFKIYSSSTIHQTTTFNLKCIFVHSHAHPLSKNWLSQHIFKKLIPNWRKWPQFERCQMYIFKIYSSSKIHQTTTFNLKYIFVHFHAYPLSQNWLSQHIFNKQIPDRPKLPQFERCQMYIFKIYSSSTIHQATTFNLKCIFVQSHAHPLSKNWLSQHIFKKTDSKLTQMTSIWEVPNVYFQNLLLIKNTPDYNLQPQLHICPLPCTPSEQKLAESAYFYQTDSRSTEMTSIWEVPNVYFQNLLHINNTPDTNLQPQMHICPLPCTPFEPKLAESAYF